MDGQHEKVGERSLSVCKEHRSREFLKAREQERRSLGGKLPSAGRFVLKGRQDTRPWEPGQSGFQVDLELFPPGTKGPTEK